MTLLGGTESLEVKGEGSYQLALKQVVQELGRDVHAILVPEPQNQYDPNAVAVLVGGLKVGYLSREDAALYQPGIVRLIRVEGNPISRHRPYLGWRARPRKSRHLASA